MKRLTIYLRNQKKVTVNGKEKLFNVKTFRNISDSEADYILSKYKDKDIVKSERRLT